MDIMRLIVTTEGLAHPESVDRNDTREIVIKLLGMMGPALIYWHHFAQSGIRLEKCQTDPKDSIAMNFLKLLRLNSSPVSALEEKALDVSLILYSEHGFNASTFASRITSSTLSDIHSCLATGIGTLKGPLHGGANEAAMEYLSKLSSVNDADKFLDEIFKSKKKLMGFGHRVYRNGDPRHYIAKKFSEALSKTPRGNPILYKVSSHIEQKFVESKKIYPNVDFFAASLYNQMGIPTLFFTPIFVIARATGWAAHVMEQRSANRLIRPKSKYIGPSSRKYHEFKPKL